MAEDLLKIVNWLSDHRMGIKTCKCVVVHFGPNNPQVPYNMGPNRITVVHEFHDLGIKVDDKLSFSLNVQRICASSYKLINLFFSNVLLA